MEKKKVVSFFIWQTKAFSRYEGMNTVPFLCKEAELKWVEGLVVLPILLVAKMNQRMSFFRKLPLSLRFFYVVVVVLSLHCSSHTWRDGY